MGYTLAQIEKIATKFRQKPEKAPEERELNKSEAIRQLSAEILALQKKGYPLEEIAASLKGEGLDISTATLKSYLQRSKPSKGRGKGRSERAAQSGSKDATKTAVRKPAEVASTKKKEPSGGGTFEAREDTKDI